MKFARFTLRELFLLVIIAAMGCAWWVDRRESNARHEAEVKQLEHEVGIAGVMLLDERIENRRLYDERRLNQLEEQRERLLKAAYGEP